MNIQYETINRKEEQAIVSVLFYLQDAIDNRCGDTVWKAASNMPRRKRNLCETGIQVVVCRHGLAQKAVNMFQGELYGYSLFLQKHLMKPNNVKFMIIDVACKYWIWLRKNDADLSQEMEPAIGAMHCKRHIASCQVKNVINLIRYPQYHTQMVASENTLLMQMPYLQMSCKAYSYLTIDEYC
eukprot:Seg5747.2 transcript_id=Seg5747.2/GoldUCD/mRNA.D3Y31 product="hypothetical protein" protein_id=Seg5747.2/GoldUCD/D3Y31